MVHQTFWKNSSNFFRIIQPLQCRPHQLLLVIVCALTGRIHFIAPPPAAAAYPPAMPPGLSGRKGSVSVPSPHAVAPPFPGYKRAPAPGGYPTGVKVRVNDDDFHDTDSDLATMLPVSLDQCPTNMGLRKSLISSNV